MGMSIYGQLSGTDHKGQTFTTAPAYLENIAIINSGSTAISTLTTISSTFSVQVSASISGANAVITGTILAVVALTGALAPMSAAFHSYSTTYLSGVY